jgi:UDP-N-acetylglucosamine--N-acetylmuramyl-(pentapeptide) pyrophosphoryl-undecaprenol N-acetylglucosamine transferase
MNETQKRRRKKIIISGGGTAGHIHPALAVGRKLKDKDPDCSLTFVGSTRQLEKRIMDHYSAHFIPLHIEGIKGRGFKIFKSLLLLPLSFLKSLTIVIRTRPDLVIGVGGYSSGPIVLLASWFRIPTLIMEQNIQPGLTNRLLRRWVKKAVVSFERSLPHFKGKGIFIGNPVREEFYTLEPKERNGWLTLLIFGGSQGSHFLNEGIVNALPLLKGEKEHLKIFHQTGEKDWDWVKQSYTKEGFSEVTVAPYFDEMAKYFQKSDLIISRAGASTIAELIASKKASLLVPFSQATDNHQLLNAKELEKINGAEVITEEEFTPSVLSEKILAYNQNKRKITEMENNLAPLKVKNAAERIADLCLELMEKEG